MADGFTVSALAKKLSELNETAISIQQLSLWLVHHKKHSSIIVETWLEELMRAPPSRKLIVLYLANDVVQNIRKSKSELLVEWGEKMIEAFNHLAEVQLDEKTGQRIGRLIQIWEQRQIFDKKLIGILNSIWTSKDRKRPPSPHTPPLPPTPTAEEPKRAASPSADAPSPKKMATEAEKRLASIVNTCTEAEEDVEKEADVGVEEEEVNGEESFDPPDPEELIQAIQSLEEAATSDAGVRTEISKLPREVCDPAAARDCLDSPEAAERLAAEVQAAAALLEDYNERLESELRERRRVARMIYEFLVTQKSLVTGLEERIDTYRDKLDRVREMEAQVKNHLASLPDIPQANGGNSSSGSDPFIK